MKKLIEWLREKNRWMWVCGLLVLLALTYGPSLWSDNNKPQNLSLSQLQTELDAKHVKKVELDSKDQKATVWLTNGQKRETLYVTQYEDELITKLQSDHVDYTITKQSGPPGVLSALLDLWPLGLILLYMLYATRSQGNKKLEALHASAVPQERFTDVIGADEVLDELKQVVRCLRWPRWFRLLGVRPLTGMVLHGPPGTGKTLIAKAIAGEAGVPFFAVNGSDFDDQYMGVGARRVRELFANARKGQVAIVFIDEIDAVGGARGTNTDSGTRGYNQTLNALLAELDGFAGRRTGPMVIVIGATNMLDSLDPALMRPGRLTRKVAMPTPDRAAREKILRLYAGKLPNIDEDVDFAELSRLTGGMSGADLAEVVNQAGLTAEREVYETRKAAAEERGETYTVGDTIDYKVTRTHFIHAMDSAELGPERKTREVAERDRTITAVHEAGHALAGMYAPKPMPPRKVTIVPRGHAGGVTWATSGDEQLRTKNELWSHLIFAMGARAAEKLVLGDGEYSTGAQHDLKQATDIATQMVRDLGMVPGYYAQIPLYDGDPRYDEIHRLIEKAEEEATGILVNNRAKLDALAAALLEHETLEGAALNELVAA